MRNARAREILMAMFAVILGLLAGACLMALTGNSPLEGYKFLFKGGLMNIARLGNSFATATPLILTGLSVAFAFKTGLFNIGAAGQMLIGGLCATAVVVPDPRKKSKIISRFVLEEVIITLSITFS